MRSATRRKKKTMPLDLVRSLDEAVEEMLKWRVHTYREAISSGPEWEELLHEKWNNPPTEVLQQIVRLVLSPVSYALLSRLSDLSSSSSYAFITKLIFFGIPILILSKMAEPLIPLRSIVQEPGILTTLVLPVLLPFVSLSVFTSYAIWFDAILLPILAHISKEISDREEVHCIVFGFILAMVFELSMLVLSSSTSLVWVIGIGIGLEVVAALVSIPLLYWYMDHIPLEIVRKVPQPTLYLSLLRGTIQQVVFGINHKLSTLSTTTTSYSPPKARRLYQDKKSQYEALDRGSIRLLRISPGSPSQPLLCSFIQRRLAFIESYEAASYVWGDQEMSCGIMVDGKEIRITENAYHIIRQRRSRWEDRLLWIDQVCINQNDPIEKSNQVQMMRSIFKNASLVTAWLGPSKDAHMFQSFIAELNFLREGRGWSGDRIMKHYMRTRTSEWTAVADFFRNPWFHRVWIVQEAASAKKLYMIYGDICMDWMYICRAIALLFDHPIFSLLPPKEGKRHPNALKHRPAVTGLQNANTMMYVRGEAYYDIPLTLYELLTSCIYFDSTDPRDKIYALLGLATDDSRNLIIPDYQDKTDTRSVYILAMKLLLKERQDPMDVMCFAGISVPRNILDLPSWVPDWSFVLSGPLESKRFSAGLSKEAIVHFDGDPSIIHLDGMCIDSIRSLSSTYRLLDERSTLDGVDYLREWFEEAVTMAKQETSLRLRLSEDELRREVLRTIAGGQLDLTSDNISNSDSTSLQSDKDYDNLQEIFDNLIPLTRQLGKLSKGEITSLDDKTLKIAEAIGETMSTDTWSEFSRITFTIAATSNYHEFCVTETGRLAVVPGGSKVNDKICLISGSKLPCILRPKVVDGRQCYELIGCCYVHRVMNGEITITSSEMFTLV
jgi:hypothetical protein